MTNFNLLDAIGLLSLFIGLLFSIYLFTTKTENKLSNRIFGLFLLLSALDNVYLSALISQVSPNFSRALSLIVFIHFPIFYFYVLSVCYSNFKLKLKHLWHVLLYLFINLILLTNFYDVDKNAAIIFLPNLNSEVKNTIVYFSIHLQVFSYLVASFLVLKKSRKIYLENYTNSNITFHKWLYQLIILLSVLHVLALIKNIYKFSEYDIIYSWTRIVLQLGELALFCWYILKALNTPNIFKSVDSNLKLTRELISENEIKESINELKLNNNVILLQNYMTEKEPFLNSSLTIQELAKQMHLQTKELSILINHTIGKHFFDFVNEYRIEKAKSILEDETKNKNTVLEILYQVGFNSKSSFNTAFKKQTNTTPTLYRKNHQLST